LRVLDALVDSLDLRKLGFPEPSAIGRPSYAANDLLKLYLYGYLHGIRSSRKLEAELLRNVELIWMLRRLKPDQRKSMRPTLVCFRVPERTRYLKWVSILALWATIAVDAKHCLAVEVNVTNNLRQRGRF